MKKEGEEVLDFSTIFYDKEKKRIVKRTERKIETGEQSGKMITNKTLVYGTDADPRLTARAGVALTQAMEDNVDRLMMDLEQSRKSTAQLKETLKKEIDEGHNLKRKFEDMQNEVKISKAELQTLQENNMTFEVTVEKNSQNSLEELQKLQL